MARPRGEIRNALRTAFEARGACTWRDVLPAVPICPQAPAEMMLLQRTVWNMVRIGELTAVGRVKVRGSLRWHALYELAAPAPVAGAPAGFELGALLATWRPTGQADPSELEAESAGA